jgi:hypothetical protein
MEFWETTKYSKWYKSHRRFSFTARHCIELYEEKSHIPDTIFKPFLDRRTFQIGTSIIKNYITWR